MNREYIDMMNNTVMNGCQLRTEDMGGKIIRVVCGQNSMSMTELQMDRFESYAELEQFVREGLNMEGKDLNVDEHNYDEVCEYFEVELYSPDLTNKYEGGISVEVVPGLRLGVQVMTDPAYCALPEEALLEDWHRTAEEVVRDALRNSAEKYPVLAITDFENISVQMISDEVICSTDYLCVLAGNPLSMASGIFYPGVMKRIAGLWNTDLIMLIANHQWVHVMPKTKSNMKYMEGELAFFGKRETLVCDEILQYSKKDNSITVVRNDSVLS